MRHVFAIAFCIIYVSSFSQINKDKPLWDANPKYSAIPEEYSAENVIGVLQDDKYEMYYSDEGDLETISTLHRIYRLNNDESINQFNTISLSMSDVIDIVEIRARAIKPDGHIVEFDEDNIKEVKDEKKGSLYRIFAIDGIEKGDDVEYYAIRKMNASNYGRVYYQYSYPLLRGSFEIVSPKNLIYDLKGFNGVANGEHQVLEDERNRFFSNVTNMPLIKAEKFSYLQPRKARLDYRLDYNYAKGKSQILTWDVAAQRIYNMMYLNVDEKALNKWVEDLNIERGSSLDMVIQIEKYLKNNIYLQDYHTPDFSNLSFIFENKVTSSRGVVKLYANLFKKYGVEHELVLTSRRDEIKFDGSFQSWSYLDEYLIYLPEHNTYLDPNEIAYQVGCIEGQLTATDGLHIQLVRIGNFESAIAKIKYIPETTYKHNFHNMIIDISVDVVNANTNIVTTQGLKGLSGGYMTHYFKMMDEERKQEVLKNYLFIEVSEPELNKLELIEKCSAMNMTDAEFIILSDITTPSILETAGNKMLLNIGKSIGPQAEMYFEDDRKALVENRFNRWYYREITVEVPEGYKIANPEASIIKFLEVKDGENLFLFDSEYTYEGNVYKVIIDEYYNSVFADESQFEGFKDVVNAAADFNKVVLVLEKE